jgi:hypothetical protein
MAVLGKMSGRVMKERSEKELQGKISEVRNDFVQGHGYVNHILVLRQLKDICIRKK